jgi:glycosyltransferase involved in cell wall biosynthesis/Ser/Thr protein kinase RdoA (MazF antagonist)
MKKVLFICSLYHPHVGGIETMVSDLARLYRARGIEVLVLTKKWPDTLGALSVEAGVPVYRVTSARNENEFAGVIDFLREHEADLKADIIHVIGVRRPLPFIGLLLAKRWGVPIMCTIAGGDVPDDLDPDPGNVWQEGIDIIPQTLLQTDRVNCVSGYLAKDLLRIVPELPSVGVLYAGIDLPQISSVRSIENNYGRYVFSFRRLEPSKGVGILVQAFALIARDFKELKLVIAGDGKERVALEKAAKDVGVADRVIFLGTISLADGLSLLKNAELTVVPSLSEGGGLVNIEAQALGCPVIASAVGGIPEYLADSQGRNLFRSGDYQDLAHKMARIMNDNGLKNDVIKRGKEHVLSFGWDILVPEYLNVYNAMISSYKKKDFRPWSDRVKKIWDRLNNQNMIDTKKIRGILPHYGFKEDGIIVLIRESADNLVFKIEDGDKKAILRISKRLHFDDIRFEYEAMQYLKKNGVQTPELIVTDQGELYVDIDGSVAVMLKFIEGKHCQIDKDHLPSEVLAHNAGRELGKLSRVGFGFRTDSTRHRNIFTELNRAVAMADIFERDFEGGKEFIAQVREAITFAERSTSEQGLIHNDYRAGNVFFDDSDQVCGIIDFDWACQGPLVKDLALAIVEWSFPDGAAAPDQAIFDAFLEGYNSESTHKWSVRDGELNSWIRFATLSDACTYFCDIASDPNSTKRAIRSFMYRKYLFFSRK